MWLCNETIPGCRLRSYGHFTSPTPIVSHRGTLSKNHRFSLFPSQQGRPTIVSLTGTKVKTHGAVTAVDGNKRGNLELAGYISNGAQDLVLDLIFWHYRAGAAPINWHRNVNQNGELLHPGNPDKDLDEKAARKIQKYRELYRDHRRHPPFSRRPLDFLPAIASAVVSATSQRLESVEGSSAAVSKPRPCRAPGRTRRRVSRGRSDLSPVGGGCL